MSLELVDFKPREISEPNRPLENWKSPKYIANYFKVSTATICRWAQREIDPLPRKKNGSVVRIDMNEARKWFDRNSIQ